MNAPAPAPHRLTLRNDVSELPRLGAWVERWLAETDAGPRDRFRIDLALTEAVTNTLTHGRGAGEVHVDASCAAGVVTVSIRDSGPAFDPLNGDTRELPARLEDANPGGLGLVLIRGYCDDARYARSGGENELTLTFRLGAPPPAPTTPPMGAPAPDLALCQAHRLLQGIPAPELSDLIRGCTQRTLAAGDVLLTPGHENHTLFFLLRGKFRVELQDGDAAKSIPILAGETVGEMSIIEHRLVFARVIADEPCTVLAMPEEVFWDNYCSRAHLIPALLESLVMRMRRTATVLQSELERRVRYEMLEREVASAAKIQAAILPTVTPLFETPAVDVHPLFKPARAVGGDFYDALALGPHRVAVAIGDVSGKGMPAALFMVRAITLLRMILLREPDPARILPEMNRQLCQANDEFMFVTLAVLILDTASGRATYLNAGHNPLLVAAGGQPFQVWEPPQGTLLGVNEGSVFTLAERTLAPGDSVVLYTDGVTEAEDDRRALFGLPRTISELSRPARPAAAAQLVAALDAAVTTFVGAAPQSDDITLLALTFHGEGAAN